MCLPPQAHAPSTSEDFNPCWGVNTRSCQGVRVVLTVTCGQRGMRRSVQQTVHTIQTPKCLAAPTHPHPPSRGSGLGWKVNYYSDHVFKVKSELSLIRYGGKYDSQENVLCPALLWFRLKQHSPLPGADSSLLNALVDSQQLGPQLSTLKDTITMVMGCHVPQHPPLPGEEGGSYLKLVLKFLTSHI